MQKISIAIAHLYVPDTLGRIKRNDYRLLAGMFFALAWLGFSAHTARATINVVSYWRMGENDASAADGTNAVTASDISGSDNLTFSGPASYSTDVAASAVAHTGSSLSMNFL